MFGRMDLEPAVCRTCKGKAVSPYDRKRPCETCGGIGHEFKCKNCGEYMPCRGTNPNIMDQTCCDAETKR